MEYIINYTDEGEIIGFLEGKTGNNIQVDNQVWFENQGMNKITIDKNKNITFDKVDWGTDKEIEAQRIFLIKAKAGELITSKYPIWKQLNIDRTGGTEQEIMNLEINTIRAISDKAEANGTALEDIKWQI